MLLDNLSHGKDIPGIFVMSLLMHLLQLLKRLSLHEKEPAILPEEFVEEAEEDEFPRMY